MTQTLNFGYTGGIQTWEIPAGTTQLTVTSDGASGASGGIGSVDLGGGGGKGLVTSSTVGVSPGGDFAPGDTLYIYAGGAGGNTQLAAFGGGGGGSRSCSPPPFVLCGGGGGQGGGGSGAADYNSGTWINIAGGGGGGGGGDDAIIEFNNGGAGGSIALNGSTSCSPPTDLILPGNAGAGTAGDDAQSGSGTGGGGGGGGGCPGGPGGKSGSEINEAASTPGAGGAAGDFYYGPDGVGFNGAVFSAPSGNGSVTIQYTYTPATLTTTPSASSAALGSTLTDTATLSGLSDLPGFSPTFGHPTGNLEFKLLDPGSNVVDDETIAVNNNGTYSTPHGYAPTAVGTYQWDVTYTSTDGFNGSISDGPSEPVTVTAAQPTITVAPSASSVQLGDSSTTLKATADLTDGYNPDGTITFHLYDLSSLTPLLALDTEQATVTGNGQYSTSTGYTLPTSGVVTGEYQWVADYAPSASDSNNLAAYSIPFPGAVEPGSVETVTPASPTLGTSPNVTTATFGTVSTLTDTADLSGGYSPGGSITFSLYYNGGPIPVDSETVPVTGNGIYTSPAGYTLPIASPATGSYQWDAAYSGDQDNNAVSDNGDTAEQTTVNPAVAVTTTTLSESNPAVTYGSESAETLSGTISGPSGDGTPQGDVQVVVNGGTVCVASLTPSLPDTATYSCAPSDFELPAGNAGVQVTYVPGGSSSSDPNYVYTGSGTSGTFTVNQAQVGSITSLNVSSPAVSYGSEGAQQFTGTVAGLTGYGTPQGVVTVMSGTTTLCSAPLVQAAPDTAGYGCQLAPAQLDAGGYPNVRAFYQPAGASSSDPSASYTGSTSTSSSFIVNPAVESTTTSLNVSVPVVTYGSENGETLSGLVTGVPGDGLPQGSVTIQAGATTICTSALTPVGPASASYSCTLTAAQLHAGSYPSVQATYQPAGSSSSNPDYAYTGSGGTASFTVNKATPVISWSSPANIVFGTLLSGTQLDATGSVAGTFAYTPAAGTLLPVGNGQVLHTTFTPADSVDYTTASATASINVTSQPCVASGASMGGGLTIGTGQAGCITGTGTVNGAVTVTSGGAIYMNGGTIKGSLTISGATAVWLCNVTITGGITITGSTGPVLVGGAGCKNSIASSVSITGNKGGVTYLGNAVKGALTITGNSGGFNYIAADNTTTGKVTVSGNS